MRASLKLQNQAKKLIPGMTQLLSKRPDMFSMGIWPGYYKKAKGTCIWDMDDNKYVDMSIGGIGANILGYCDPDVDAAVQNAVKMGSSSSLNCYEEVELAQLICDIHPWAEMVRFARTGGEAMAVAVRIARAHTGKDVVAFCGYHGWHDWYLSANLNQESALDDHLIAGLNPKGVPKNLAGTAFPFRYNHLEDLEKIVSQHRKNLAAIVMEPIRNFDPDPDFIRGARRFADQTGAVLIVDEISAGFRLNSGGAHLKVFPKGGMPDIAVFSKALGNGYPIAAIIGRSKVMESAQDTFISSTYWTERIGPVAAISMIKKHQRENVSAHLTALGEMVQQGWKKAAEDNGLNISVGGLKQMTHFSFKHEHDDCLKAYFIQLMLEKGFLASTVFYAMYAHTFEDVRLYLEAVDYAFKQIRDQQDSGKIQEKMTGKPAQKGFGRIA